MARECRAKRRSVQARLGESRRARIGWPQNLREAELVKAVALILALAAVPAFAQTKQVVVYTANEDTLNSLVFDAFAKETGVTVQPVAAGSGVLVRRLASEKDRPQGDIIWGVSR